MFVPHSEIDLKKMFEELSIISLDDLFTHIPETLKLNDGLNLPPSLSELESISDFENLESKNTQNLICFAGGGHYDVYLPQTVKSLKVFVFLRFNLIINNIFSKIIIFIGYSPFKSCFNW